MYDSIIIGGGPAGASAAIYLARFKKKVAIIIKDKGALGKTAHIDNYYGFVETITGDELFKRGLDQCRRLGVDIIEDEVISIESIPSYEVKTLSNSYETKTIMMATGKNQVKLRAKNFNDFIGKGISYCAICDGFLYRNKKIGLVGNKEFMLEEFEILKNFTKDITVFDDGLDVEVDIDVPVVKGKIEEIKGDDLIKQITVDGKDYDLDVLFIAIGSPSASDFAQRLGAIQDPASNIVVDKNFMTNVPGLFAGGDCIGGLLQVSKSVSDGAHAAIAINKYLKTLDK